jgi:hypothetical protein
VTDPTQTVHIELEREEAERLNAVVEAGLSEDTVEHPAPFALKTARDKLRAALSSSPEQGGEEGRLDRAVHELASTIGRARVHLNGDNPALAIRELNGAAEAMGWLRNALSPQPPAPALSDEEGGRLCQLADELEEERAGGKRGGGCLSVTHDALDCFDQPVSEWCGNCKATKRAAFLRTLASQEQGVPND